MTSSQPQSAADFQRASDAFISWFQQASSTRLNPKISVVDLRERGAGRGVVALEDLPDDTELFAVPRKFILSIENSNLHNLIAKDQFPPGPWLQLMLTMIYEFLRGERSDWYPYFAILPHHFDTPMFWSETELQELQGSEITNMIGKDAAEESIRQHLLPVMLQNPQHFPGLPADEPAASAAVLELAHRMGSLIKAYAFDIANEDDEDEKAEGEDGYITDEEDGQPPAKGMVPFADLLNANADLNNARLFHEDDYLVMKTIRNVPAGEELFNDYGPLPRSELLLRYGYVTDRYEQYDIVIFPMEDCLKAADIESGEPPEALLEYFESIDYEEEALTVSRFTDPDAPLSSVLSHEFLVLIQALLTPPSALKDLRKSKKWRNPDFCLAEAQYLCRLVQGTLDKYATNWATDKELLKNPTTRRQAMALEVRLGEKVILIWMLENLHEFIKVQQQSASSNGTNKRSRDEENGPGRQQKRGRN